jgi:hypothetical protein
LLKRNDARVKLAEYRHRVSLIEIEACHELTERIL